MPRKSNDDKFHPHKGFTAHDMHNSPPVRTLNLVSLYTRECPICSESLKKEVQFEVPISPTQAVFCKGLSCGRHLFTTNSRSVQELLNNNPFTANIKINRQYLIENFPSIMEAFQKEQNAKLLVLLKGITASDRDRAVLIGTENKSIHPDTTLYRYDTPEGKDILDNIFKLKNRHITFGENRFFICGVINRDKEMPIAIPSEFRKKIVPQKRETKRTPPTVSKNDNRLAEQKELIAAETSYIHPYGDLLPHPIILPPSKKQIHITTQRFRHCPVCNKYLFPSDIEIPIGKKWAVTWSTNSGSCVVGHCIVAYSDEFQALITDNPYISHITVDDRFFIKGFKDIVEIFKTEKKAVLLILLKCLEDGGRDKAIMIGNQTKTIFRDFDMLNYTEIIARELLTKVFRSEDKEICYAGRQYALLGVMNQKGEFSADRPSYILQNVMIRKSGGYSESLISPRYELVDVLLYSPFTDCFELTQATYDKNSNQYFMDSSMFRDFVYKFGNPNLTLIPDRTTSSVGYLDLQEESILRTLGYTVSEKENLSPSQRQKILSFVIDYQLMTQAGIVNHLQSLISFRESKPKYANACYKWEQDIAYVQKYEANPDRFIIAAKKTR